jgi:hypothetical protein
MFVGYARVSTTDQNLDGQLEELQAAGCTKVYHEKLSGALTDRPQLRLLVRRSADLPAIGRALRTGPRHVACTTMLKGLAKRPVGG